MPEPTQITGHSDQAVALLIEQYQEKPNLEKLIRAYVDELQHIEDAIWDVLQEQTVTNATGVNLDVIGRIVGEDRHGANDDDYRVRVTARIAVNRSSGQWFDLNSVASTLFSGTEYRWINHKTMSLELRLDTALSERPGVEQATLEEATGAGTRLDVVYSVDAEADRFAFGSEGGGFSDGGLVSRVSSWGA